ncbi:uncharacterized protein Z519_02860 [Cladophialophora bantiana CBS 173.52]|uniref:FAD-binding domain-containing protein n=1 Tax=Cladophialophora bantiana (strain ATCC 10958 / CBS 173.52 / CDC B-1940 / NIH 8579) TaxID=1442370 RepID=A0A0D2F0N8_CLAB1|nr:uncharacterized protein Z519_02860 [Cladophialophora bantiana CBS 173.52]KIW95796.1 hypothetical protein Z519_02860 [Cladophialophora bantiana CBS 173.52]
MPEPIEVPVVIVGGGSCGLSLSIFLSDHGVQHILFERHAGTSILPKAHIINQRTMEIFRQHGIADEIIAQGTPPRQLSQVVWQTSLAGNGPLDRKILGTIHTWGCKQGTERNNTYVRDAPHLPTNLPLLRSEPILRSIAETRNPGKVLFSHTVTDFEEKEDCVLVYVSNKDGTNSVYRATYLVGADGGKMVGPKIGVEMEGPKGLRKIVSTHFKADLSEYWDDRTGIAHFCNPSLGLGMRSGSMLPLGPTWGRYSEEWQMHFAIGVDDPLFPREDAVARIRQLLKLPDLELEVLSLSNWVLERVVANKYSQGRVFIGGDSAHRHPPTTGLGLNTAVQDSQNLAWKLAYVLQGKADVSLLDTYEMERLPTGKINCDWALFTSQRHHVIAKAIGIEEGKAEANEAHFLNMFDEESEIGKASRAYLQYVIDGQKVEFAAHEMDLGFVYPQGSFVPDGTVPPPRDPMHQHYTPTTRPGHRLPHAWLDCRGAMISTHDLVGTAADFLLITDRDGAEWVDAARKAAKARSIGLRVAQIVAPMDRPSVEEYVDLELQWAEVKGVGAKGAVLVRPDNIVAWRSSGPGSAQDIAGAFDQILGRRDKVTLNGVK